MRDEVLYSQHYFSLSGLVFGKVGHCSVFTRFNNPDVYHKSQPTTEFAPDLVVWQNVN